MLVETERVRVSVRVPRGAAGDVEGGVRDVLQTVEGVSSVEVCELAGVRPDALDLYVDAEATVTFEAAVAAPRDRLRDGFGVIDVTIESP